MQCLKRGEAPSGRHDTDPPFLADEAALRIPAGARLPVAGLMQVRGDWDWFTQCFRFRTWNQAQFCWLCDASQAASVIHIKANGRA